MTDSVADRKRELRLTILAARGLMTDPQRLAAGKAIAGHGFAQWEGVAVIAAYLSVGTEPPTRALIEVLAAAGSRVLLPVIDGSALDWAQYDGPDSLAPGPLGLSEPTAPRLGGDALASAGVVLVPALAVDHHGNRLGRGRGFYDRTLAGVTSQVIAVVFDAELIDAVPVEAHDRRVDAVLQPRGLTSSS